MAMWREALRQCSDDESAVEQALFLVLKLSVGQDTTITQPLKTF
jgi:hypothetical protein